MSAAPAGRWGARALADGRHRFGLWAPTATAVDLVVDGVAEPMQVLGAGWFEVDAECSPGCPYRFRIDGTDDVPDPASRWQPHGVDGASAVPDADGYRWTQETWRGRPWQELVLYEVHLGSSGGCAGLQAQLPALAAMGITAIELMPVAQFPGRRNWGYDGVFPFAPAEAYGPPDALKRLVDEAHRQGIAVLLDVVYNHFGPQGNHLQRYAPTFFAADTHTPWGAAIDFTQPAVQQFFIDNALMWLHEYRFDGLRLDAVHAIAPQAFLQQLADAVRGSVPAGRHVHLVLENEHNQAHWLRGTFDAQWNDDFHNALHVLLTGEVEGYYAAYSGPGRAAHLLARCLAEGFAWQGEATADGRVRGEPSVDVPPERFVVFAQNHDQIGNRAFGDRLITQVSLERYRAALALTLLTPMVPLVFMGEPWGARQPFQFFTDFDAPLDEAVREGRRNEFAAFAAFADPEARDRIPDPNAKATLERSRVALPGPGDKDAADATAWFKDVLALRRDYLQPGLAQARSLGATVLGDRAVQAGWQLPHGQWWVALNAGENAVRHALPEGDTVLRQGGAGDNGQLAAGGGFLARWMPA